MRIWNFECGLSYYCWQICPVSLEVCINKIMLWLHLKVMFSAHCRIGIYCVLHFVFYFCYSSTIVTCLFELYCRTNTLGAYLISPAMGSHFIMYLAKMQGVLQFQFGFITAILFAFTITVIVGSSLWCFRVASLSYLAQVFSSLYVTALDF